MNYDYSKMVNTIISHHLKIYGMVSDTGEHLWLFATAATLGETWGSWSEPKANQFLIGGLKHVNPDYPLVN